ncbi:MAG: hypothetical protein M1821_010052 [Bathelium mastoideum]|nr:MAG: hypothetical protein M1821_010052 [Bathelium mastoideum]
MNSLVDNVNAKIKAVCDNVSQCVFVAMDGDIQTLGGHFCEPGVDESYRWGSGGVAKDREETWFYEWGTTKDDDDSLDKSSNQPERRDLVAATSLLYFIQIGLQNNSMNIANYTNDTDQGLTLQPYDSDNITLAGSILPDSYGRVFHLNKFANGDIALRILDAMDSEQAKMMSQPLPTTTLSICTSLVAATQGPTAPATSVREMT